MAVEHVWSAQLDCIPQVGDLTNVVKEVHWRLDSKDGDYTASRYGVVTLPDPDPNNFVELPGELSDEDRRALVRAWALEYSGGAVTAEEDNAADIARQQVAPVIVVLTV